MKSAVRKSLKLSVATFILLGLVALCAFLLPEGVFLGISGTAYAATGGLTAVDKTGKELGPCPLKHTEVKAELSAFVSHVTVTQTYENPFEGNIEAVYTFPLSADGAVYEMLMKVGDKTVKGDIKRREEAEKIYQQAKDQGKVASLLDQERPNIFTQYVANIVPGASIEITIKYVELLPYADGKYTFSFPMVVGPRFIPGSATGKSGTGSAPDTTNVPDASKITPPVTPEGTRTGHDVGLTVIVNAGMNISGIRSLLHDVEIDDLGGGKAMVVLKNQKTIPNKDFVLEYTVAEDEVKSGVLVHKQGDTGYLTIMLVPPKRLRPDQVAPKEMIFVVDRSGSQSGAPIQKAKDTMEYMLAHMNPEDTFNIISFSNSVESLFPEPRKNSSDMVEAAKKYIASLQGNGGTYMGPAIQQVCNSPAAANRLRIVTFMTDGYVGNDFEMLGLVKKLRGKSRWFPFGTGNSVNRFLISNMASIGGGEAEYVLLTSSAEEAGSNFYKRIASPVLTDISVDFGGLSVEEIFPREVVDLWDQKPLYFRAQYTKADKGTITLRGNYGGRPYEQKMEVVLPDSEPANSALSPIWARAKVEHLMGQNLEGLQYGSFENELKEEIVKVALEHRIMTQFTSFVAVEESIVTEGGVQKTVVVPVEMPEGVSYKGVFGTGLGTESKEDRGAGIFQKASSGGLSSSASSPSGPSSPAPSTKAEIGNKLQRNPSDSKFSDDEIYLQMDPLLFGLADRVVASGKDGNYTEGSVVVKDGIVTVRLRMAEMSEKALNMLKELGFEITVRSDKDKVLTGRIDVKKLDQLAKMDCVNYVEP